MAISYFFSGIFFDQFVFDCNFALSLDPHHVLNWLAGIFVIYKHFKCLGE